MENRVSFALTRMTKSEIYSPTKYEFRKSLGYIWIQKLCFYALRKIGAQAIEYTTKYSRLDIEFKSFMQTLSDQRLELISQYALEGDYLLMGAEDFAKLMGDSSYIGSMIHFTIPDAVYRSESHMDRNTSRLETKCVLMNMNVVIVPWMKGMLVMPSLPPMQKTERSFQIPV